MSILVTPPERQLMASTGDDRTPGAPGLDTSSSSSAAAPVSRGRVIEFYVPETFQLPARRWIPPEARGKIIEFPGPRIRKSA